MCIDSMSSWLRRQHVTAYFNSLISNRTPHTDTPPIAASGGAQQGADATKGSRKARGTESGTGAPRPPGRAPKGKVWDGEAAVWVPRKVVVREGMEIVKHFPKQGNFKGRVVSSRILKGTSGEEMALYHILYDDGDEEELDENEIQAFIISP